MKHKNMSHDNRYKYRLNMLAPGLIMVKNIGALFVFGIVFWVAKWHCLSTILGFLSEIIFAVLLILAAIEAHQDNVLNDIAMRENNYGKRRNDLPQNSDLPFVSKLIIGDANRRWKKEGQQVMYEEYQTHYSECPAARHYIPP